jgi:hypothetical protein
MKFSELFQLEKQYLGGGYFHPDMYIVNPVMFKGYENSGETFLDIDLKNGGSINVCDAGIKFWDIIHGVDAQHNWSWNYFGGDLLPQLSQLASQMIFPEYRTLLNSYLSKTLADIVNQDAALTFNFLYATFNGAGYFKYFAAAFDIYVNKQGVTDPKILMDKMIYERENISAKIFGENAVKLLKQGAAIMKSILALMQGTVEFDIIF